MPTNLSETENHIPCVEIYGIISGHLKYVLICTVVIFSRLTHELQGLECHEPLDSAKGGKFIE